MLLSHAIFENLAWLSSLCAKCAILSGYLATGMHQLQCQPTTASPVVQLDWPAISNRILLVWLLTWDSSRTERMALTGQALGLTHLKL